MRNVANKHIEAASCPAKHLSRVARAAWLTGLGSISLYTLLYIYSPIITQIAKATIQGDKSLFFFPILIVFAFTLVHGKFTGYFWDALGLKAKA